MQDLINLLTQKAGITADQASTSLQTIKEYVKDKFPMLDGAVENMFSAQPESGATATPTEKTEGSLLDKISDVIPGATGEKVEEFAKNAAHKAEDVFDNVKDKLSNFFGGDKK